MSRNYLNRMTTPSVQLVQDQYLGQHQASGSDSPPDTLGSEERAFIQSRDSCYLATSNENGWPYLQHRGGPIGFLKMLGPSQLGFADYRGNRQLLTTGNLSHLDRIAMFLMDYPTRSRLKILGYANVFRPSENSALAQRLIDPAMQSRVERLFLIKVEAFDWNCTQYITPRFTATQLAKTIDPLKARITALEAELRKLRAASRNTAKETSRAEVDKS